MSFNTDRNWDSGSYDAVSVRGSYDAALMRGSYDAALVRGLYLLLRLKASVLNNQLPKVLI